MLSVLGVGSVLIYIPHIFLAALFCGHWLEENTNTRPRDLTTAWLGRSVVLSMYGVGSVSSVDYVRIHHLHFDRCGSLTLLQKQVVVTRLKRSSQFSTFAKFVSGFLLHTLSLTAFFCCEGTWESIGGVCFFSMVHVMFVVGGSWIEFKSVWRKRVHRFWMENS